MTDTLESLTAEASTERDRSFLDRVRNTMARDARLRREAEEDLRKLIGFLEELRDNWDCDPDAHTHGTRCRVCVASSLLQECRVRPKRGA